MNGDGEPTITPTTERKPGDVPMGRGATTADLIAMGAIKPAPEEPADAEA